jgi:hypothetical protein
MLEHVEYTWGLAASNNVITEVYMDMMLLYAQPYAAAP